MKQPLKLCISPCPNDTFMFDALVNGRITNNHFALTTQFADIEELNVLAQSEKADVCKVSYAVWPLISDRYALLSSGSALGRGNGPLLVARGAFDGASGGVQNLSDSNLRIAIPGLHTTANLLMDRLFPALKNKTPVLFSQIAERVANGEFDAGVLIHEGRFTYADHGLRLCADLGVEWERRYGLPLPLGAIVVRRALGEDVRKKVDELVRASVQYALENPNVSRDFVKAHAREMDNTVIDSHIALFVNEFSLDIGEVGRKAIDKLVGIASF